MIKIYLGNVGSGKTACYVRELFLNKAHRNTYSNIKTKKLKNNNIITSDMLVKKDIKTFKMNRKTGEQEPVYEIKFNEIGRAHV